jgi:hypothetical protein
MDADIKQRWVAALRSGHYKQGRFDLRFVDNTFCCLGVLVDLVEPSYWSRVPYEDQGSYPPESVRTRTGITGEEERDLAHLNDWRHMNFDGIANYIENYL